MPSTPEPQRLLVVSPNWLGDAVMALPAIADLRRAFPAARLTVAARGSVAAIFQLAPGIDDVLALEWGGRRGHRQAFRGDVARIRAAACDTTVLLPNSFASAWLVWRARVPQRWGYAGDLRSWLLTRAIAKPAGSVHQGTYYQRLVQALDVPSGPLEPLLTARGADLADARALLTARGWDGRRRLVALAPGAAYGTAKQWLPEHFVALVAELVGRDGATCVLVGGKGSDATTTAQIRDALPADVRGFVIDLAGATSLQQLAGVLSLADACVSNDSGAMHVAAALGVPTVAIFGPTNERETAPLTRQGTATRVLTKPVDCRPCMLRECPIDHRCMSRLEPAEVHRAVHEIRLGVTS
jgi:heptosyltransferase II